MSINWSVRDLQVLQVLAETLSFRRTAERMHMSQPAVTALIGRLEDNLGARLFDRSTRAVNLTVAGSAFVAQAGLICRQAEAAAAAVRDVVALRDGHVRMAALPSLAATVVPAVFAQLGARHPGLRLDLIDTLSNPAFELVRAGQVDFALTAANPAYADLAYTPLAKDHFVLLMPAGHPLLAGGDAPLPWADCLDLPHISMPAHTSVRQYAESACQRLGRPFEPRFEVEHLATLNAMVAAGLGVAALPELAALVARSPQVVQRRLGTPDLPRPIGLVTRRGRALSLAAQTVVQALQQQVQWLLQPAGAASAPIKRRGARPNTG
ncbi:LysR substrate-binding domain-containing protein [Ideonella sp.]|uniref:LysR family transcriptional regulator n=1 Tax=Ideonella sp. TaxID=1929293 RepID=UPI003BB62E07